MRISECKESVEPAIAKKIITKLRIKKPNSIFPSNFAGKEEVTFADITIGDIKKNVYSVAVKEEQETADLRLDDSFDYIGHTLNFDFSVVLKLATEDLKVIVQDTVKDKNKKKFNQEFKLFLANFKHLLMSSIAGSLNKNELFKRNLIWYSLSGIPKYHGRPPAASYLLVKDTMRNIETADERFISECLKRDNMFFKVSEKRGKSIYNKVIRSILRRKFEVSPSIRLVRQIDEVMTILTDALNDMEKNINEIRKFVDIEVEGKIKLV